MTINEVNLEHLDRYEYFALIKIILLGYRYVGFEYNNTELRELEDIIYKDIDPTLL